MRWSIGVRRVGRSTLHLSGESPSADEASADIVRSVRRAVEGGSGPIGRYCVATIDGTQFGTSALSSVVSAAEAARGVMADYERSLRDLPEVQQVRRIEARSEPVLNPGSTRSDDLDSLLRELVVLTGQRVADSPVTPKQEELERHPAYHRGWPTELGIFFAYATMLPWNMLPGTERLDLQRSARVFDIWVEVAKQLRGDHPAAEFGPQDTFSREFVPVFDQDGTTWVVDTGVGGRYGHVFRYSAGHGTDASSTWLSLTALARDLRDSLATNTVFASQWVPDTTRGSLVWRRGD